MLCCVKEKGKKKNPKGGKMMGGCGVGCVCQNFRQAPHSSPRHSSTGGMESNKHRVAPAAAGAQNVLLGRENVGHTMTYELVFIKNLI